MSELAQLQTRMAEALLHGQCDALDLLVRPGPVTAQEAFGLHRATALHGLVNALRLTYPTVDALVGADFFDQAALAFVEADPPASPWLTGYGSAFADFLAAYDLAAGLTYLADAARLDAAIEAVAGQSLGQGGLVFDLGQALLTLDASLRLIELDYPAATIRDALEAGDDDALAAIDMTPRRHVLALWRMPGGAAVRPLHSFSAAFLKALLHGGDVEAVLTGGGDPAVLQTEVFSAPFARLALLESPLP
jgi:hypothetical protein